MIRRCHGRRGGVFSVEEVAFHLIVDGVPQPQDAVGVGSDAANPSIVPDEGNVIGFHARTTRTVVTCSSIFGLLSG